MSELLALLLTDVVDSTRLNNELGDDVMAALWKSHDAASRKLIEVWHGREVGRSDGFLLIFKSAGDAVGFAQEYHRTLAGLVVPLTARVGVHVGPVLLRQNSVDDMERGATPFEVDGVALPVAARVMSAARGGQTLLTESARLALGSTTLPVQTHGHWRLKGLSEPIELFEVSDVNAPFAPPLESTKAYRVVWAQGGWTAARELPHSLPAERDAFIGRSDELRALGRFSEAESRLVTLLGIGGIGKTRLALRFARDWIGEYPGGAWFCDLSAARGVDGIAYAVAQGLGVPLGKTEPIDQLGAAIAGRGPCLVVLDNFEQVVRHAEQFIGAWLERAPEARFIVTSREVLGIPGEQILVLAPLSSDEAVQMYRHRMRAAGFHDVFAAADEAALAPLVGLLDRLPLAIELAAARVRLMPPRMLLERMGERFKLLVARGGRHDRQATLRATLDWSWDLLSPAEQTALAQTSVFEGGFTLDAAEAVVDVSRFESWIGDVIQALIEKSLMRRTDGARIELLRTVQEYAAYQLAQAEAAHPGTTEVAAAQRHWKFFSRFEREPVGPCLTELENLATACRRSSLAGDGRTATACLLGAWQALKMAGPFRAALGLIDFASKTCTKGTLEWIKLQWITGRVHHLLGDQAAARRSLDDGLSAAGADPLWRARLLCASGEQFTTAGRVDAATEHLKLAVAAAAGFADNVSRRDALNAMGVLATSQGDMAEARRCYEEALGLCADGADADVQGALLGNLGEVCINLGRATEAHEHLEKALTLVASAGHRRWEGNIRCNLGLLHHEQHKSAEARQQLESALQIARDIGYTRLEATVLCNLGIVCAAADLLPAALDWHEQAVALAAALGDPRAEGQFRTYLGQTLINGGRHAAASECLSRGEVLLRDARDLVGLALLLCERARVDAAFGLRAQAMQALDEARRIGEETSMDASSELGRALQRGGEFLAATSDVASEANQARNL